MNNLHELKPYKFLKLSDLNKSPNSYIKENFRIVGKLIKVDYVTKLGIICFENLNIIIKFCDISNRDSGGIQLDNIYQVFGTVKHIKDKIPFEDIDTLNLINIDDNPIIVEAKIIRNVNGINSEIYLKTVDLLNEYLYK